MSSVHQAEVDHWNAAAARADAGMREFWLGHPRIRRNYANKGLIEGLPWRAWVRNRFQGPAINALELGCGRGLSLEELVEKDVVQNGFGVDLDDSRFQAKHPRVKFIAADINKIQLERNRYDLIYALQSFHHFEALEHILQQVQHALTPRGVFLLDEFVGPARFQWTDSQLAWTSHMLALMPRHLRIYTHGIEKRREARSSPEEVIRVCASEAIRSNEIPALFAAHFKPIAKCKLGGTIQHLLYSGIVHNFPYDDPEIDYMIDNLDAVETSLIGYNILPSDFMLLIGEK